MFLAGGGRLGLPSPLGCRRGSEWAGAGLAGSGAWRAWRPPPASPAPPALLPGRVWGQQRCPSASALACPQPEGARRL